MNSRERVNVTLEHKEPDKVPIDLGGNQSSIHIIAYKNLLEYLEIEDDNIQYADFVQQNLRTVYYHLRFQGIQVNSCKL